MKNKHVVIKRICHSRASLSGIYNACRCKTEENALLNGCVEDPRQRPSGMTHNYRSGGNPTLKNVGQVVPDVPTHL